MGSSKQPIESKLDEVIELLQHLLILELAKNGVSQEDIGKHIHIAKSTVVKKMKGTKKGVTKND